MGPSASEVPVADPAPGDETGDVAAEAPSRRRWGGDLPVGALMIVALAVPLVVALVALARPRWYPILDLAMTELRVRDVGTGDTPLIGLPGRIGTFGSEQGSHPGPLSFWLLAPTYRVLGSTAWAMFTATVVIHLGAVATAGWLARRRGGTALMVAVLAVLAVLVAGYGGEVLTQPWNPYMPLLWWFVVLLATWSVLCGDLRALPVFVFAGSFCSQTHVPYAALVGGLGLVVVAGIGLALWEHRDEPDERRSLLRWLGIGVGVGVVLWLAPLIDHLTAEPSNLTLIIDHFSHPSESTVGIRRAVRLVLLHLDPWRFVSERDATTGSSGSPPTEIFSGSLVPGIVVLALWAAAVAFAVRLRHRLLVRLHVVVAAALALGTLSISRIFGQVWYYLMIWAWGITALLVLATGWTAVEAWRARAGERVAPSLGRIGAFGAAVVVVASAVVGSIDGAHTEVPAEPLVRTMAAIVPPTVEALGDEDVPGRGRDERYLVTWADTLYIGAQGIALLNELERAGFDVGAEAAWGPPAARHRVRAVDEATSYVQLVNGTFVDPLRNNPDAVLIAYVDPRGEEGRVRYEQLRSEILEELAAAGLDDLVPLIDGNLFGAAIDPRLPDGTEEKISELHDLGLPTAVFVGPRSSLVG